MIYGVFPWAFLSPKCSKVFGLEAAERLSLPLCASLLAQLKARIFFFLPLFFKRFHSPRRRLFFVRQWGAGGIIGSVSGEPFSVCL